jgi:hypothetical protein
MTRLQAELLRLYLFPGAQLPAVEGDQLSLSGPHGEVRCVVLGLSGPADWRRLSAVWQGVQADFGMPAPAIAVTGVDGFQLWFSLATPVALADAQAFGAVLRGRYLGQVSPARLTEGGATVKAVPSQQAQTGHWSAFVAPDLAPVFADDPWLDLRPSDDAQADVLSRLGSVKPLEFQAVLSLSQAQDAMANAEAQGGNVPVNATSVGPDPEAVPMGKRLDPREFLQSVMDDPRVALPLRIDAAKALLPGAGRHRSGE